jgi:hypothetical protein
MPVARVRATWALTASIVVGVLLIVEVLGRARGFAPSVKDGPEIWSAYRRRADHGAPLVLVGSSRFMLGIDPSALSQVIGRPVIDLAIDGSWPFPVLEDLAADQDFHGYVLCEMGGFIGNAEIVDPQGTTKPNLYLKYFHTRTWVSDEEALLRERVQDRLVFLVPELSLRQLLVNASGRSFSIVPPYVRMLPGRFRPADYTKVDLAAHRKHWEQAFTTTEPHATSAQVLSFADRLGDEARRIRQRGGDVIFMRMLSSGGLRAVEDRQSPRQDWDMFAARVGATALHFEDVPSLRTFVAADGSHLDERSVGAFSLALGQELERRGVFSGR